MTETQQRFHLADFNAILFKNCYGYVLPSQYMKILEELESQLDVSEQPIVAPTATSRNRDRGHVYASRPNKKREEDWEAVRAFKATKIETKVGIEKTVNDVRIALNKMSTSNYEKQKDAVLELVGAYFGSDGDTVNETDTQRISKAIFDIASTNKFYSEIYAKLYVELAAQYAVFRDLIAEFVANFSQNIGALTYVDPDVDYDGYCLYTKSCDNRKATTTFIVNCLKRGLISPDKVFAIIRENLACIDAWVVEEGKTKEVEEIVESVFIVLSLAKDELKTAGEWTHVINKVKVLAKTKGKSQVSWSNRAAFKMMDLVELV